MNKITDKIIQKKKKRGEKKKCGKGKANKKQKILTREQNDHKYMWVECFSSDKACNTE